MKHDINKDLQGQDYTKPDGFILDRIMDKGSGVAFWVLTVLIMLGCYGLLWIILALPYIIG